MDNAYFLRTQLLENILDLGYRHVAPLDRGAFGDVFSALSTTREQVAIKFIKKDCMWKMEEEAWPVLKHDNILPVLYVHHLQDLDATLFVTPLHPAALDRILCSYDFLNDACALRRVKFWLHDVLSAIDYLHTTGLCHLDIKCDNVLISSTDSAVLCDFSGLNTAGGKLERFCSPLEFRPPECFQPPGSSSGTQGVPFDMWTFGLMALNALTRHWPIRHMVPASWPEWTWETGVQPALRQSLEIGYLHYLMQEAFPRVLVACEEAENAFAFLLPLLSLEPNRRCTAEQSMDKDFLKVDVRFHENSISLPAYRTVGQKLFGVDRPAENVEHGYAPGANSNHEQSIIERSSNGDEGDSSIRFFNEKEEINITESPDGSASNADRNSEHERTSSDSDNCGKAESRRHNDGSVVPTMAFESVVQSFGSTHCLFEESSSFNLKEAKKCMPKEKDSVKGKMKRWFKKKLEVFHRKKRYEKLYNEG